MDSQQQLSELLPAQASGVFSSSDLPPAVEAAAQEQRFSNSQHLIWCIVLSHPEQMWTRLPLRSSKPSYPHSLQKSRGENIWRRGKAGSAEPVPVKSWEECWGSPCSICASCLVLMSWQGKDPPIPEWKKYAHISLICSQLNPHHDLQPALHIIKAFIFVLQNLSAVMECLWSAAFLSLCVYYFIHALLHLLHFPFFPQTISFLPSTIQPTPSR